MHKLVKKIQRCLTDDLRRPPYRGNSNPLTGHCYVASEAIYHLWAREQGYKPYFIRHEGSPHWFLRNNAGTVIDPTSGQFKTNVDYARGIGKGFLTRLPSKRARILMNAFCSSK